jgi:putative flippase GtrA
VRVAPPSRWLARRRPASGNIAGKMPATQPARTPALRGRRLRGLFVRWVKFNAVGALGIAVQLGMLALLVGRLRVDYLLATAVAVESAVMHNFIWHEYFTWSDRTRKVRAGFLRRLLSFHASNGMVSLFGNLLLMRLLVGIGKMPYVGANMLAILACGLANFALAELVVFVSMPKRPSGA